MREEHDSYEALKLKHASMSAQLISIMEQLTQARNAQATSDASLAEVQQRLAEVDAAAEERLTAMKANLQSALNASKIQQAEHAKLEAECGTLRQQLILEKEQAADVQAATTRESELKLALQVGFHLTC